MDWNRHAGGREELPPLKGPQTAPGSESRVAAPSASVARRPAYCQQKSASIGFNGRRLLHQFQQAPGLSGSLRDVQMLARHLMLSTTQRHIETDALAMRQFVELV
jgi:hypothetical protein